MRARFLPMIIATAVLRELLLLLRQHPLQPQLPVRLLHFPRSSNLLRILPALRLLTHLP